MHQHDQELIMALAEESLDPEAARAARDEVASCRQCTADLELQQFALNALEGVPEAQLTEMESARLRRDLRTELGLTKPTASEPSRKRRRMPLAALGTAAAVLVAVVVVGPGLDLIGGSSEPASDATIVADAPATTTAPATEAPAAFEAAPNAGGAGEDDTARTTMAPAETTTTARPVDGTLAAELYAFYADEPDLAALRREAETSEFNEDLIRSEALSKAGSSIIDAGQDQAGACIAVTITNEPDLVDGFQIARGELDDRDVIYVIYLAEDLTESLLIVQAADNCEELRRVGS